MGRVRGEEGRGEEWSSEFRGARPNGVEKKSWEGEWSRG